MTAQKTFIPTDTECIFIFKCRIFLATNTFSWNSVFAMTLLANSMTVLLVNGRPIFPCLIKKSQMIGSTSSINGFSNGLVAVTFFL